VRKEFLKERNLKKKLLSKAFLDFNKKFSIEVFHENCFGRPIWGIKKRIGTGDSLWESEFFTLN
jgi:hypothetical protein